MAGDWDKNAIWALLLYISVELSQLSLAVITHRTTYRQFYLVCPSTRIFYLSARKILVLRRLSTTLACYTLSFL